MGALLRDVSARLRPNLVTRPTGHTVRNAIERRLGRVASMPFVSLIDFSRVPIMDYSCADEVVARLVSKYLKSNRPLEVFFLFRAAADAHRHSLEAVLRRHGLAAVCHMKGSGYRLLGNASAEETAAWDTLEQRRQIDPHHLVSLLGARGEAMLASLVKRRLVYREPGGTALALSAVASRADSQA